jgi:hypothetical protein
MLHIEPTKITMKSIAACATSMSTRGHLDMEMQAGTSLTDIAPISALRAANNNGGNALHTGSKQRIALGSDASDTLTGTDNKMSDRLYGGAGDDPLEGQGGNDYLEGGTGQDTYTFGFSFGKDTFVDTDGLGRIRIGNQALSTAKASRTISNQWDVKLDSGVLICLSVADDARSATGKRLVITQDGDTANSITINNFDRAKAKTEQGYLGKQLTSTPQLAGTAESGSNVWADTGFTQASLAGKSSSVAEGSGKTFSFYLNQAARQCHTLIYRGSASRSYPPFVHKMLIV